MLWFEEKDALKRRLADYEAENSVSHYHLVLHAVTFSLHIFPSENICPLAATFIQSQQHGERDIEDF